MQLSSALLKAIDRYLAGESRPEDEKLINDWYHSFDDGEVEIPEGVMEFRDKVGGRIGRRLLVTINEKEAGALQKKRMVTSRRVLMAAATLLLLLCAGEYLFVIRHQPEKAAVITRAPVNDVAPGGNKAVLTLANGSRIVLDSAHNGMLARQGSAKILKLNSGKLVYHLIPRAGSLNEPLSYNTITTPRGGQFQVTLPDGTNVWLNAASSLRYPTQFADRERTVQLTGEAYFEVAKNPRNPFIVDMPDYRNKDTMHIQVLGTNFNVNGYEDEGTIKTTLVQGSVKVVRRENSRLVLPGQQAQTDYSGGFRIIRHADIEEALAWKNGLFKYNSTNLQVIMRQIARWYDVQVVYAGKAGDEFFSGSVPRTENASQILHMLAMTNTVRFNIEGKTIRVERVAEK
jgi:ferric-dicitrate binding protein FerR (iron transport regulator)